MDRKNVKIFLGIALIVSTLVLALIVMTVQPFTRPAVTEVPPVSPDLLKSHVLMLSETLHPRSVAELTNLEAAADYVHAEFAASGGAVTDQWFEDHGGLTRGTRDRMVREKNHARATEAAEELIGIVHSYLT